MLGLDTNLTAEAKATGLFAPSGIDAAATNVPGGWSDDTFVPYDYGYFAVIYDSEKLASPPKSLRELVEGDPAQKIVIQDPRTSTPGLGLLLWVGSVYGDEAPQAWAKLKNRVLTVTPGWSEAYGLFTKGEAPMVLSYTTSPAYHIVAEGHRQVQGRGLLGRTLSAGRGGGHDHDRGRQSAGRGVSCHSWPAPASRTSFLRPTGCCLPARPTSRSTRPSTRW